MYPTLCAGSPSAPQPFRRYPSEPTTAIGKPTADAVPIAVWNGTLQKTRNGIVKVAPPMAASAEQTPITVPATKRPGVGGSCRVGFGFQLKSMLEAM